MKSHITYAVLALLTASILHGMENNGTNGNQNPVLNANPTFVQNSSIPTQSTTPNLFFQNIATNNFFVPQMQQPIIQNQFSQPTSPIDILTLIYLLTLLQQQPLSQTSEQLFAPIQPNNLTSQPSNFSSKSSNAQSLHQQNQYSKAFSTTTTTNTPNFRTTTTTNTPNFQATEKSLLQLNYDDIYKDFVPQQSSTPSSNNKNKRLFSELSSDKTSKPEEKPTKSPHNKIKKINTSSTQPETKSCYSKFTIIKPTTLQKPDVYALEYKRPSTQIWFLKSWIEKGNFEKLSPFLNLINNKNRLLALLTKQSEDLFDDSLLIFSTRKNCSNSLSIFLEHIGQCLKNNGTHPEWKDKIIKELNICQSLSSNNDIKKLLSTKIQELKPLDNKEQPKFGLCPIQKEAPLTRKHNVSTIKTKTKNWILSPYMDLPNFFNQTSAEDSFFICLIEKHLIFNNNSALRFAVANGSAEKLSILLKELKTRFESPTLPDKLYWYSRIVTTAKSCLELTTDTAKLISLNWLLSEFEKIMPSPCNQLKK